MNSDSVNKWLTLAANLGVIGGLILVAYEINQTAAQFELAASADGTDNFVQAMETLVQDEDLARLIYRAEHTYADLDAFEKWRVSKYLDGFMTMSEQDFRVLSELSAGETDNGFVNDWRENMQLPMYREYWQRSQFRYSLEFRVFIDGISADLDDDQE